MKKIKLLRTYNERELRKLDCVAMHGTRCRFIRRQFIRRLIAVGCILLVAFGVTAQASTKQSRSEGAEAENVSLSEAEKEKKELEEQLEDVKQLISALKDSKGDIEEKLAQLNTRLIRISERIADLEFQLAEKNYEIELTRKRLESAELDAAAQYEDMKVRIQFMYENRQTSYLDLLLSSNSISELLNAAEYIIQIEKYDRQKLGDYEKAIAFIEETKAQLEQDYEETELLKADVEEEKQMVAELMQQKETELAELQEDIAAAQDEEKFFEAEIKAQDELIAEIMRIEAEKAAAGIQNNPYSGGTFTWPCPSSKRITSDFGPRTSPTAGASTDHKGIDIGASYGADIVAAAPGTVRVATYSSTAGNYVMIDHGGGLYTVYMHASSLTVSAGDVVTAGQVIAKVGSTGISTGNHLHFGVSLNGSYVSPWDYLGGR